MLTIEILGEESYDESEQKFVYLDSVILELEHSLVALSKWESKHEKPFLGKDEKTKEETLSYIYCMIVTPGIHPNIINRLENGHIAMVNEYISAKMTATWFTEHAPEPKSSETITSELVYYWISAMNLPIEVENWHLNRLFALIKIASIKSSKPKKMTRSEIAERNRKLNAERRKQLGTTG